MTSIKVPKSLKIFEKISLKLQRVLKCSKDFWRTSKSFGKSSESLGKSSELFEKSLELIGNFERIGVWY